MKVVLINQSVHGYSEGHRLLESSVKLPDEIARLMLRMSDLSGGSVFPGFEEYLTGYPLAPLNMYVFAKTWYASEMPRPGCVWTHSLILKSSDLEAIKSLDQLNKLFVRPKALNGGSKTAKLSGYYVNSIRFDPDVSEMLVKEPESKALNQIKFLVNSLYNLRHENLLVAANSSASFEASILRIWSQQWPGLRGNLSFCTGALSARGFAGRPFNIQCAPPQLLREITTSALVKQSQQMTILNRDEPIPDDEWITSTVSDAELPAGGQFREALWSIADGSRLEDFKSFSSLVVRFLSGHPVELKELVEILGNQFPDKATGAKLKRCLFGQEKVPTLNFGFSEWEILSELSISEHFTAFDSESLGLRVRANLLCLESPDGAKQLISKLFRGPINPLGEDVLAGLLEALNPEIARRITAEQPYFLPTLFRAKPELGTSPELWRAAGDHARELFESLSSRDNLSDELITGISEAIVASGAETLVRRAFDRWGRPAVFGVLNHASKSETALSERVVGALTFHNEWVMNWLFMEENRPLFARVMCAHVVAPYSYQIKDFGSEVWLRTYEDLRSQSSVREVNYVATLLLALGLQNTSPTPVKVIALCFEHIHGLAWDDKMPDSNWIILDPLVPHLSWFHDWDKCERLRRGLIEAFVRFGWPREQLHDCIQSDDLLRRTLKSAKEVDGGHKYFNRKA